jgi:hypothetical protein
MDNNVPQGEDRYDYWRRGDFNWPLYLVAIVLLGGVAAGVMYASKESQQRRNLDAANQRLAASLAQIQAELLSVNQRTAELAARAAQPPAPAPRVQTKTPVRPPTQPAVHDDPRLGQIQRQLSEHGQQLASARADIDRTKSDLSATRDDLQNNISSTKNELNGSIARTHDEVVALQRRGERNYYEFAVDKSKHYSRVGPLSVELRNADAKHKRFDMMMLVEDNELQKKNVNLYETVWISTSDKPQPLELVVNRISKDHIEGYLSEPKYKKSELESSIAARPSTTP